MSIRYENESSLDPGFALEKLAQTVVDAVLDDIGCPYVSEVGLLLTGEEKIQELNRQYRQIDRVTDVLSFPMITFDPPGEFAFLEDDSLNADCFDPDSGELVLGDIVICAEKAREQAKEYGHSLKREFAFLIAHSVLHLLGYDHERSVEEEKFMEERQRAVLENLGITR